MSIWEDGLNDLYNLVPFDGLWLDMNEITGFCNGECPNHPITPMSPEQSQKREVCMEVVEQRERLTDDDSWFTSYSQDGNSSTYYLPFIPGNKYNFDNMTMSLNATHPKNGHRQYDTHNLNGLLETKVTKEWLTDRSALQGKRPFILSRSTFAGSGKYANHWLGDNHREWAYLNYSISGVMNFNMFGIPMAGPDTCGFFEARTEEERLTQDELCGRWVQLSTFYPFARMHRDIDDSWGGRGGNRTEPYLLKEPFKSWATNAIKERLTYIRHLYTCLYTVSREGGTCYDPLIFHYPNDDGVFDQVEHTFIMGDAFKVSPVLEFNTTKHEAYFPAGEWVDMHDYSKIISVKCPDSDGWECVGKYGKWVNLTNSLTDKNDKVQTHLKPGSIGIIQDSKEFSLTKDTIDQPVTLVANRDYRGVAEGKLFFDDGESLEGSYEYY